MIYEKRLQFLPMLKHRVSLEVFYEVVFDDVGFEVGDASYELRGKIKGDKVEFTSTRVDMSSVPRKHRWVIRSSFDSHDPKEYFSDLLGD